MYICMNTHLSRVCILYRYSKATGNEGIMPATNRHHPPKKQLPAPSAKRVVKNNRVKITLSVKNPMVVLLEGMYMYMCTVCVYSYKSIHSYVYIPYIYKLMLLSKLIQYQILCNVIHVV